MDNIKGVSGAQPPDFSQPNTRRVEPKPKAEGVTDKVDISTQAAKAAEISQITELAKAAPDIDLDTVERAKARVDNGTYLKPEVTREVAEKIIDSL